MNLPIKTKEKKGTNTEYGKDKKKANVDSARFIFLALQHPLQPPGFLFDLSF